MCYSITAVMYRITAVMCLHACSGYGNSLLSHTEFVENFIDKIFPDLFADDLSQ